MKALDVAKYILNKCTNDNHPISNLQLQKILYYIQHDFLVRNNKPLFDDDFEAWKFGPAIPVVYYRYCGAGGMKLNETYNISLNFFNKDKIKLDKIIEDKRKLDPWTMVRQTHAEGKAWDIVFKDGAGFREIINKQDIKDNAF